MSLATKVFLATVLLAFSLVHNANAATVVLGFVGSGVNATLQLTYGPASDQKYSAALQVVGISGTFTDTNNGLNIVDAPVTSLIPVTQDSPEPTNLLAPKNFSRFAVATGLSAQSGGFLTYDNLVWPNGSPQTATDYPLHGGILDIYGLMFGIGGGRVVDIWSNGTPSGSGAGPIYGVAVATSQTALDYVGGVSAAPEPGTIALLGGGLGLLMFARRRTRA